MYYRLISENIGFCYPDELSMVGSEQDVKSQNYKDFVVKIIIKKIWQF